MDNSHFERPQFFLAKNRKTRTAETHGSPGLKASQGTTQIKGLVPG